MTPRLDSLQDVRHDLLDLHRALVEAERRNYERGRGRLPDRDFLEALINDPALGWLSALTALIVRLDELLEEGSPEPASAREHCVAQIRKLLKPAAGATEFHRKYAEALQQSPDVVVAHGKAMRALERAKAL